MKSQTLACMRKPEKCACQVALKGGQRQPQIYEEGEGTYHDPICNNLVPVSSMYDQMPLPEKAEICASLRNVKPSKQNRNGERHESSNSFSLLLC